MAAYQRQRAAIPWSRPQTDIWSGGQATTWMSDGACTQVGGDVWFADPGHNDLVRAAKRVCATCPVQEACRDYALAEPDLMGVWGGLSKAQRQRWRVNHRTSEAA